MDTHWEDQYISYDLSTGQWIVWDHKGEYVSVATDKNSARLAVREYTANRFNGSKNDH